MEERLNRPVAILSTKLIIGLFVTLVGLLLTADNLDLFEGDRLLRYWPAVLVVIGLLKLPDPGQRVLGTILTIAGASLLAFNAG